MNTRRWALSLVFAVLGGCSTDPDSFAQRFTVDSERDFAVEYLTLLVSGDVETAFDLLVPELQSEEVRQQLTGAASLLAVHPPDTMDLIGVQFHSHGDVRKVNLSWEYQSGSQWIALNIAAQHSSTEPSRVHGFGVHPLDRSLREPSAFTLRNRSATHYLWLVAMIGSLATCLLAILRMATARGMPRRWLWLIASGVGVSQFTLNWQTAEVSYSMFSVVLFGAAALSASPAAPWMLSFGLPIGALLAFRRHAKWQRAAPNPPATVNSEATAV